MVHDDHQGGGETHRDESERQGDLRLHRGGEPGPQTRPATTPGLPRHLRDPGARSRERGALPEDRGQAAAVMAVKYSVFSIQCSVSSKGRRAARSITLKTENWTLNTFAASGQTV